MTAPDTTPLARRSLESLQAYRRRLLSRRAAAATPEDYSSLLATLRHVDDLIEEKREVA